MVLLSLERKGQGNNQQNFSLPVVGSFSGTRNKIPVVCPLMEAECSYHFHLGKNYFHVC